MGRPGAIPDDCKDDGSWPGLGAPGFFLPSLVLVQLLALSPLEPAPFLGWDGDGLKDFFDEFCMADPIGLYFW